MSRKQKKLCTTLNYVKLFLKLDFSITRCISISAFASLLDVPIEITSSAVGLKTCVLVVGKEEKEKEAC